MYYHTHTNQKQKWLYAYISTLTSTPSGHKVNQEVSARDIINLVQIQGSRQSHFSRFVWNFTLMVYNFGLKRVYEMVMFNFNLGQTPNCQDVEILRTQMSQMRAQKGKVWGGWCTNKGKLNWRSLGMISLTLLRVLKDWVVLNSEQVKASIDCWLVILMMIKRNSSIFITQQLLYRKQEFRVQTT